MSGNSSVKKNAVLNIINSLLSILFPVITFAYASRVILPDGVGRINYAKSFSEIFIIFASLGISTYGIREGAKLRNNKEKLSNFVQEILLINTISTFITYICYFLILYCWHSTFYYRDVLLIYSITILTTTFGAEWFYGAIENYRFLTIRKAIVQIFSLFCMIIFVKEQKDYLVYAQICVLANVGSNIFSFFSLRKFISFKKNGVYCLKRHIIPILLLFGSTMANTIHSNIDTVMLGAIIGSSAVGLYSAAIKINKMIRMMFSAATAVCLPALTSMLTVNEDKRAKDLINKGFNMVLMLSLPMSVGLSLFSKEILKLFCGVEFLDASLAMCILSPLIVVTAVTYTTHNLVLIPRGKEKEVLFVMIISVFVNVLLNLFLIRVFQEKGAAIATLISEILCMLLNLKLLSRYLRIKELLKYFWQYCTATVLMSIIVIFIKNHIPNVITMIFAGVIVGIISYFSILIAFKNEYSVVCFNKALRILKIK